MDQVYGSPLGAIAVQPLPTGRCTHRVPTLELSTSFGVSTIYLARPFIAIPLFVSEKSRPQIIMAISLSPVSELSRITGWKLCGPALQVGASPDSLNIFVLWVGNHSAIHCLSARHSYLPRHVSNILRQCSARLCGEASSTQLDVLPVHCQKDQQTTGLHRHRS
jgi:hypothetical protein